MDTFQALADPNRRKIIELIASSGKMSSSDISDNFNVSKPAISQHLKVLRQAKLVDMEKRAQAHIYTVNSNTMKEMERWISEMIVLWNKRFDKLEKVLEREKKKMKGGEK